MCFRPENDGFFRLFGAVLYKLFFSLLDQIQHIQRGRSFPKMLILGL